MKKIPVFLTLMVALTYIVGFIYDSVYLEEFGIDFYEIIASPLDYLAIGGIYLLNKYVDNLYFLFFSIGFVSIIYAPIKRRAIENRDRIEKYLDFESIPHILWGFLPVFFLFFVFIPVVPSAQKDANQIVNESNDKICIVAKVECLTGKVLRFRDSKIIFYDSATKKVYIFADQKTSAVEYRRNWHG